MAQSLQLHAIESIMYAFPKDIYKYPHAREAIECTLSITRAEKCSQFSIWFKPKKHNCLQSWFLAIESNCNMASKRDEKTFKGLMKNMKLLMPPRSMKTCHRFFKARAKIWVRQIVQGNMQIDNVWARWSVTYDAIVLGQEVAKGNGKATGKTTDKALATSIMKQAFLSTSIVPITGIKLHSPTIATRANYCTECGLMFANKQIICKGCGRPKTGLLVCSSDWRSSC